MMRQDFFVSPEEIGNVTMSDKDILDILMSRPRTVISVRGDVAADGGEYVSNISFMDERDYIEYRQNGGIWTYVQAEDYELALVRQGYPIQWHTPDTWGYVPHDEDWLASYPQENGVPDIAYVCRDLMRRFPDVWVSWAQWAQEEEIYWIALDNGMDAVIKKLASKDLTHDESEEINHHAARMQRAAVDASLTKEDREAASPILHPGRPRVDYATRDWEVMRSCQEESWCELPATNCVGHESSV